jgi:hypothetical protein
MSDFTAYVGIDWAEAVSPKKVSLAVAATVKEAA